MPGEVKCLIKVLGWRSGYTNLNEVEFGIRFGAAVQMC